MCGAEIEECEPVQAGEIKLPLFPMIYLSPHFATCYTELKQKVKKLKITAQKLFNYKQRLHFGRR